MIRRKVGFFVFLFLISSASLAFASLSLLWPIEMNQLHFKAESTFLPQNRTEQKLTDSLQSMSSSSSLSYQAWHRIQTSA